GTEGLLNVFRLAAERGVTRVGVASTIGVYDGPGESPLREDLPLPLTAVHPIPAAKKVHELLADFVANGTGLEIYLMRIGAVWGPLGRPASRFFAAPELVHAAVSGRAPDQPPYAADGADLIYARDCGRAIALLQLAERLSHRTYNVSGGRFTSNAELAAAIADVVPGPYPGLRDGRDPHGPGRDVYLDIARLREDVGFESGYDTPAAVADYVGWLRSGHERQRASPDPQPPPPSVGGAAQVGILGHGQAVLPQPGRADVVGVRGHGQHAAGQDEGDHHHAHPRRGGQELLQHDHDDRADRQDHHQVPNHGAPAPARVRPLVPYPMHGLPRHAGPQ